MLILKPLSTFSTASYLFTPSSNLSYYLRKRERTNFWISRIRGQTDRLVTYPYHRMRITCIENFDDLINIYFFSDNDFILNVYIFITWNGNCVHFFLSVQSFLFEYFWADYNIRILANLGFDLCV